jgi:bifunctional non-homologous end joining protein LigD
MSSGGPFPADVPHAPQPIVGFIEPCLPTQVDDPPHGPDWIHEIKHDGYRMVARKLGSRVSLFTRRGHDWSYQFPQIAEALAGLRARSVTIDGEAVWCDPKTGLSIFDKLHGQAHNDRVFLYAFDLLEFDGDDLRGEPLEARRHLLLKLVASPRYGLRYNDNLKRDGAASFAHACRLGAEGIVSKRRDAPYQSGRTEAWLKIKNPASPAVTRIEDGTW